jgi:hypothetical protein
MTRNILFTLVGALAVACAVLGYHFYQERQDASGIQINVGKSGVSIKGN